MAADRTADVHVDLLRLDGIVPVWGIASRDLNATLLVWPAGHELVEHTNAERDVLLIVLAGGVVAIVDGHEPALAAGTAMVIEKGKSRSMRAGDEGARYLSVHIRRGGLDIEALR